MQLKVISQRMILPVFLSLSLHAFALTPNAPMPDRCPSTGVIQSIGIDFAEQSDDQLWVVGKNNNKYDTKEQWTFGIVDVEASNKQEALDKGKSALATLNSPKGPIDLRPYMDAWACLYQTLQGNIAVTVTPPFTTNLKHILSYIK